MPDLLIRDLDPGVMKRLKYRAQHHHRSVQGEVKYIVERAVKLSMEEAKKLSDTWHKRLTEQTFTDSAECLREDRDR